MMKPNEYIKKFGLDKGCPLPDSFWKELANDFNVQINLQQGFESPQKFNAAVSKLRQKWDALGRKTGNRFMNEKAWGYFYATVVIPVKEHIFPGRKRKVAKDIVLAAPEKYLGVTWMDILGTVIEKGLMVMMTRKGLNPGRKG